MDLRERIVASWDAGDQTQPEIATRYAVSLGLVKKLLAQRKRTGSIAHRLRFCGRKPYLTDVLRKQIKELIDNQPDITLKEIKHALNLTCSLTAIHYAIQGMNVTFKKKS